MKNFLLFTLLVIMLMIAGCSPASPIQVNTPSPDVTPVPNSQVDIPGLTIRINAPGPNPEANKPNQLKQVAGLWMGLWHGFIAPITLTISYFNANVQMYEVHNNGFQYNLGFLIGLVVFCVVVAFLFRRKR